MLEINSHLRQLKRAVHSAWLHRKLEHITQRPTQFTTGQPTVIGFMSSPTGLGYGARLIFKALEEKGYSPNSVDISKKFYPEAMKSVPFSSNEKIGDGPLIFHVNGPELLSAIIALGPERIKNQKIIVVWAWEQKTLPKSWLKVESYFDELWASSHFLENMFLENLNTPIHYVPYPVASPSPILTPKLEASPNVFRVYSSFDPKSGLDRKNPEALIQLFRQGFEDNDSIALTLQVADPNWPIPDRWKTLKNVSVVNAIVTDAEIEKNIADHDCVISLHRSEGFGFLIARALNLGLLAIFTEGFGSDDFSNCPGAFKVTGQPYFIQTKSSEYDPKYGQWLDPDIDKARSHLQTLSKLPKSEHAETAHKARLWWKSHYGTDSFIGHIPNTTKLLFS